MVFRQKPLEKANFIVKMAGPAGQLVMVTGLSGVQFGL